MLILAATVQQLFLAGAGALSMFVIYSAVAYWSVQESKARRAGPALPPAQRPASETHGCDSPHD